MNEQKKYCTFTLYFKKQIFLSFVEASLIRFNNIQNNTPPMPILDAHLGGFFFSGHE
jgi:hypothetical protein